MGKSETRAKNKYNRVNYDRIGLMLPKGYKDKIKQRAEQLRQSVNNYIYNLIAKDIEGHQNDV